MNWTYVTRLISLTVVAMMLTACGKNMAMGNCDTDEHCPVGQICADGFCVDEDDSDDDANDKKDDQNDDVCEADETLCDGECVDIYFDRNHCGECGNVCDEDLGCWEGQCAMFECPGTQVPCGVECVDINSDFYNCGGCGTTCDEGQSCENGECVTETVPDCDQEADPFGGGDGSSEAPYTICTADHLRAVDDHLDAHFELAADIDLTGESFEILGDYTGVFGDWEGVFSGRFDGRGFEIQNLTLIDHSENAMGLFGVSDGGEITDLALIDAVVEGDRYVGAVVGINDGTIENVTVDAEVRGSQQIGGVAGYNGSQSTINSVEVTGGIRGTSNIGGVVGENLGAIESSHSRATVDGADHVGGMVGHNEGLVLRSFSEGGVEGQFRVGGLVGENRDEIRESVATADVTNSGNSTGGLVGRLHHRGEVVDSYATGDVNGVYATGGLVGAIVEGGGWGGGPGGGETTIGEVHTSYSTGSAEGSGPGGQDTRGGLVGLNEEDSPYDNVVDSYWNVDTSGVTDSAGGQRLSDDDFGDAESFEGFDFEGVWQMGADGPKLSWE